MSKASQFIARYGLARFGECVACKVFYRALQTVFRFDAWHATAPFACREYKMTTAKLATSLKPHSVVDIGCGLGEVLAHIAAPSRYGLDVDRGVIRAARLLHGRRIVFATASIFQPSEIGQALPREPVDLVIMTNWLHGMDMDAVCEIIAHLASELTFSRLLIDTYRPEALPDGHAHTVSDLARLGIVRQTIDAGDGVRDLHVIEVRAPA